MSEIEDRLRRVETQQNAQRVEVRELREVLLQFRRTLDTVLADWEIDR